MTYALALTLLLSVFFNLFLLFKLKKRPKKTSTPPEEFKEFLTDLLTGPAMIAVARVDPQNIMIRSPRSR